MNKTECLEHAAWYRALAKIHLRQRTMYDFQIYIAEARRWVRTARQAQITQAPRQWGTNIEERTK